ncbi:hypothetical protein EIN_310250, partial [Entamoeba invadens IP1]
MVQIESVYLMKVALHFETYSDVYSFIQVSKSCLESVKMLHINPWFISIQNIKTFFYHFHTETINCLYFDFFDETIFSMVSCIRCPNFNSFVKSKEDQLLPLLSKIYYIGLYNDDKQKLEPTCNFFIQNAKRINSLRKVRGELNPVVKFFESYTSKGNDLFARFPYTIEVLSEPKMSQFTEVSLTQQLMKYIPQNGITKIIFIANEHRTKQEDLRFFEGVDYHYDAMVKDQCDYKGDAVINPAGLMTIKNTTDCKKFNGIIEKCFATQVSVSFSEGNTLERVLANEKQDVWNVPKCVENLSLKLNNINEEHKIHIPILFDSVQEFNLDSSAMFDVHDTFSNIEELMLENVLSVTLKMTDAKNLKRVCLENCTDVDIISKYGITEKVMIETCSKIRVNASIDHIANFLVMRTTQCVFRATVFDKTFVQIEDSTDMFFEQKFGDEKSKMCPFGFCNISLEKFEKLVSTVVYYPSHTFMRMVDLIEPEKYFWMKKLFMDCPHILVQNDVVKRMKSVDGWLINVMYSTDFCNVDNRDQKMIFLENDNWVKCKEAIRYFEVTVEHMSVMSVGLVNISTFVYQEDQHCGWVKGSIGYFSDEGKIFFESCDEVGHMSPYGRKEGQKDVIGCGYYPKTRRVFT